MVEQKEAELVEVPVQTAIAFKLDEKEVVDEKGLLLKIYNKICKIEKSIA